MKLAWFKRKGIFFVPSGIIGWVILTLVLASMVFEFIRIDESSHSVSDTLMNFAFNALIISAAYTLAGYLTSPRESED